MRLLALHPDTTVLTRPPHLCVDCNQSVETDGVVDLRGRVWHAKCAGDALAFYQRTHETRGPGYEAGNASGSYRFKLPARKDRP